MVTVLDTYGFWKEFDAGENLPGDGESTEDRPLADVLVEGIEFCDVLVMNKTDMVPDDVLDEIESVAERLGPRAKRIRTSYSEVNPDEVLDTGRFDFETATRSPGWKREIAESEGEHGHEPAAGQHEHDHARAPPRPTASTRSSTARPTPSIPSRSRTGSTTGTARLCGRRVSPTSRGRTRSSA